jgi:hypothetical protein
MADTFQYHAYSWMFVRPEIFFFIMGIGAHLALFRRGEWDRSLMRLCYSYVGILLIIFLKNLFLTIRDDSLKPFSFIIIGTKVSTLAVAHLLGVFGSMSIYRLFFHRLTQFPGPFWARLSGFYMLQLTRRKWHRFEETHKLHQRYGDFVRVGK